MRIRRIGLIVPLAILMVAAQDNEKVPPQHPTYHFNVRILRTDLGIESQATELATHVFQVCPSIPCVYMKGSDQTLKNQMPKSGIAVAMKLESPDGNTTRFRLDYSLTESFEEDFDQFRSQILKGSAVRLMTSPGETTKIVIGKRDSLPKTWAEVTLLKIEP